MTWRAVLGRAAPFLLVGAVLAFFLLNRHTIVRNPTGPILQSGGPGFDPIRADEIQTILSEDGIPAIINPTNYVTAERVTDFRDDEQVIGVVVNADARAFPVSTLSAHEIVDDTIGGKPLAVTW